MTEESLPGTGNRMPVLFVGHGSPMNAVEDNAWSRVRCRP
jgi:aromatic ring-opening dioxygenase catalytic subunit (LigB family)